MRTPANAVAVVIPLYQGAPWIETTLQSVLRQTHSPAEILVVDDGSTDGSPDLVARFPGIRLALNPGRGVNAARRFGMQETRAPLLAFLDQDDLWHPDHLRLLVSAISDDPGVSAVACLTRSFSGAVPPAFDAPVLDATSIDPWDWFPGAFTPTPSGVLIRRSALEAVGGWTPGFGGAADVFMWLRLSVEHGVRLNRCSSAGQRYHEGSHGYRLRAREVGRYIHDHAEAAIAGLQARAAVRPMPPGWYESRRELVRAAEGLVTSLAEHDAPGVVRAATLFERAVTHSPEDQIHRTFNMVSWYLKPLSKQGEESRRMCDLLLDGWPRSAARTARALRWRAVHSASLAVLIRRAVQRPTVRMRWETALGAALLRLVSRESPPLTEPAAYAKVV